MERARRSLDAPRLTPSLPPLPRPKAEEQAEQYRQMGVAYLIPTALIAPILILTIIGAWMDRTYKASYFTLAGAVLGIVVGFINMIRFMAKLNK